MSLYGLRRSLFTRLPGIWLLAGSVGVAYACSPQVEVGEPVSQAMLAAADESPSRHSENCDDHSPGITASLGKVTADDLRNLPASTGPPRDLHAFSLLPLEMSGASFPISRSPHSVTFVYLATARLRI